MERSINHVHKTTLSSHQNGNQFYVNIVHIDMVSSGKHSAIINCMVGNCLVSSAGSAPPTRQRARRAPPHSEHRPEWRGRTVPQACDPINISEQVLVNSVPPVIRSYSL